MARKKRAKTFDPNSIGVYHCYTSVVRRAYWMGYDLLAKRCYDHRRGWIQMRLVALAAIFAMDHLNFGIMGNHVHVLLRNRPDIRDRWTDEEVIRHWWLLYPQRKNKDGEPEAITPEEIQKFLKLIEKVAEWRRRLGCISWLMKSLNEYIAVRANAEDQLPGDTLSLGHFWKGRFKMNRILDEAGLLACAMYIDLNPIRAMLAETLEASWFTSALERLQATLPYEVMAEAQSVDSIHQRVADKEQPGLPPSPRSADWLAPVQLDERGPLVDENVPKECASNRPTQTIFVQLLQIRNSTWTGTLVVGTEYFYGCDQTIACSRLDNVNHRFTKLFRATSEFEDGCRLLRHKDLRIGNNCTASRRAGSTGP